MEVQPTVDAYAIDLISEIVKANHIKTSLDMLTDL